MTKNHRKWTRFWTRNCLIQPKNILLKSAPPDVEGVDAGEVWGIERDPQRDFPAALDLKAILSLIAFYVG
jgi:hypothetical protein